jgi:Fe-S-cluster containining protein
VKIVRGACCKGMFKRVIIYKNEIDRLTKLGAKIYRDLPWSDMAMNINPCPFLKDNQCSIYEQRPFFCKRYACETLKSSRNKNDKPKRKIEMGLDISSLM